MTFVKLTMGTGCKFEYVVLMFGAFSMLILLTGHARCDPELSGAKWQSDAAL